MSTHRAYELSGDVAGLSDEEYNASGSYDYPPVPRSANQVRMFWATTEIPDEAIAHYEAVYTEDAKAELNAKVSQWESIYPAPPPPAEGDTGPAKAQRDEWERARNAAIKQFREERRLYLYQPYARIALRINKLAEDTERLRDEAEQEKIWGSKVEYDPDVEPRTIPDFLDRFGIKDKQLRYKATWTTGEIREYKRKQELAEQQQMMAAASAETNRRILENSRDMLGVSRTLDRVASTSEAALAAASDARDNSAGAQYAAVETHDGLARVFAGDAKRRGR